MMESDMMESEPVDCTKECSAADYSSVTIPLQQPFNRLVCIEYPCRIRNEKAMLETLGGEDGMSKTFADPSKRLELCFRPQDPYCHPVCGNRYTSMSLLLRVRRRIQKVNTEAKTESSEKIPTPTGQCHMEVLGFIGTTYKFQGLADFQYLAFQTSKEGKCTSLYDKIILQRPEKKEFFDQDLPLFIPPPLFSRLDNPTDYFYRPEIQHREGYTPPQLSSENLIGLSRARRPHNAIFVNFEDKEVPKEPMKAAVLKWKRLHGHTNDFKLEEAIKQMFDVRPIWSRNAVKANLDIHPDKLKLLLPFVAYYMLTGPWRSMWVRFGYDPRKDPKSKVYQVLDFRIRCGMKHGYTPGDIPVKAKRSAYDYKLPITVNKTGSQPASLQEFTQGPAAESFSGGRRPAPSRYRLKESVYIFREGTLPPYRQMFYQLCDLQVDSLQKIIHQNDTKEAECTERDGWCVPKTNDELRNIMSNMIMQVVRSKNSALLPGKKAHSSSKEGQESIDMESAEEDNGDEEEEFHPSDGSENEMETEILDFM
ncbi:general transcription factor 3C polypeptide 5 [Erpetoichthys calabaricus]|uniref:general transcription factor 3C polypeptide 5 n=1 Tax=Erpetoichthys calabaricus TaxID=27687 RepID=UPI002234CAE0|nr:general transcription factor 3C polypeptide 5 [Erpetoichthys calabaricus]